MTTTIRSGPLTINVEHDMIEVTSSLPYLDPKWRFTDSRGHEHTTDPQTYVWIQDEPDYWVDDGDGYMDEMPGAGHYECPFCHEHLTPGTTIDVGRRFIPGMTTAWVNLDGRNSELSEAQFGRVLEILTTGEEAEAIGLIRDWRDHA